MITRSQATELYGADDLIRLGMEADAVRKRIHPGAIVSYGPPGYSIAVEFAVGESVERFLERLEEIQETRNKSSLTALMPVSNGTAMEYLKGLALTRLFLPDIEHVQTSLAIGEKLAQIALRFGANDICGDETKEEEIRRLIRDAGFIPKQRDPRFQFYGVN